MGEGLDPDTMTQQEKDAEKDAYTQALYPGAVASPDSMVCSHHAQARCYPKKKGE